MKIWQEVFAQHGITGLPWQHDKNYRIIFMILLAEKAIFFILALSYSLFNNNINIYYI